MSSEIAIKVENLGKCYQIYDKPHDRLKQMLVRGRRQYYREFWALKNVSFQIKKGEVVGVVGRNGSGKSTLLQLICGTLNPTKGSVSTGGRIAALLELGSGFNPEFTGRENVYMNAAILGLSREETELRFEDIVSFAEIHDYIDQPVKTYSSGMMMRLAFAVAINVDPEILIVDEALSVGDELFQRKCFSRIETIRSKGATILFVSHSGAQIVQLCDRTVLLDYGELLTEGQPKQIVGLYQKLLYAPSEKREIIREQIRSGFQKHDNLDLDNSQSICSGMNNNDASDLRESFDPALKPKNVIAYEPNGAYIENPVILDVEGNRVNNLIRGKRYQFTYNVRFSMSASHVRFGMLIKTVSGLELGGATTAVSLKDSMPLVDEGAFFRAVFWFDCSLTPGTYFMNAGVLGNVGGEESYMHRLVDAVIFRVKPDSNPFSTGIVDFSCHSELEDIKEYESRR